MGKDIQGECKETAFRVRQELERVMSGDEWLADSTLDYLEHLLIKQLDRAYWDGIRSCASPEIRELGKK